jgi:thaumarchaeosortase
LAYGKDGLKAFSISLALIAGVGAVYMIDTLLPYGAVRSLQILALPTAACAAAVLEIMGYSFTLLYSPGLESMPLIRTISSGSTTGVNIGWPCAGVHSLLLYTLIILLLFRKSSMSNFRKLTYFIIGAIGTYFVNILRIVTYFLILVGDVHIDAKAFHESYGELYSMVWILFYVLLIACIQKFSLAERTTDALRYFLERLKSKVSSPLKSELNENESI